MKTSSQQTTRLNAITSSTRSPGRWPNAPNHRPRPNDPRRHSSFPFTLLLRFRHTTRAPCANKSGHPDCGMIVPRNSNARHRPTPPSRKFLRIRFASVLLPCQSLQEDHPPEEVEPNRRPSRVSFLEIGRLDRAFPDYAKQGPPQFWDGEAHQAMNQPRPAPQFTTQ